MDRQTIQIPTKAAEITPEWLNSVLAEFGFPKVEEVEVTPVDKGYYGSLARLGVFYQQLDSTEPEPPKTFFVKFTVEDPETREALKPLGINKREVNFYSKLAEKIPFKTPRCFACHFDEESHDSLILLEYVEGEVSDDVTGASYEQAKLAISEAARLHGAMQGHELLNEPWVESIGGPIIGELVEATRIAVPKGVDPLREVCPSWMLEYSSRAHEILGEQLKELNSLPDTLIHMDYRLANMIFTGDAVTHIDWHSVHRGPGICDIGFFSSISLTVPDRRAWEKELFLHYLRIAHDWKDSEWPEWFETAWRRFSLVMVFNCIRNAAVLDLSDSATKAFMFAWVERAAAIVEDHNALRLLN